MYYVTFVKKFPKVQQITGSGLAFATVLTLGVVPVLYAVLFRVSAENARPA